MKAMKFRVKDEQHSKEIQEALFAAGYKWSGWTGDVVQNTEYPFLFANSDCSMSYGTVTTEDGYFHSCGIEEFTLLNGKSIPVDMVRASAQTMEQPAEKPLVRTRKQFIQERQVELLRGLLAQAEAGKELDDDLTNELAEIQSKLRYL